MASATNWLSFSLSPIEMLRSSEHQLLPAASSAASPNPYFADAFYGSDWANQRGHGLYAGEDESHRISDHYGIVDGVDGYGHHQHSAVIPKLEDFLGGGGEPIVYSDSQTETQDDSSLTHLYDHHHHHGVAAYFGDHHHHHHSQELKAIPGFQAFPTNSGSEVDDSVSMNRTQAQIVCAEFVGQSPVESPGKEMSVSQYASAAAIAAGGLSLAVNNKGGSNKSKTMVVPDSAAHLDSSKRIADTFGQRTSIYRGVTRHRWTGRYEAHLWDNSCRREGQARKGRQVYLGGYDKEDKAARAYDLAALKYWGPTATTNFPISNYSKELEEMKHVTKQEFIASLRRKSSGFSRGASVYRGVTRHHQQGRWQARIGRVAGNKDLYLGTFATEEEAAEAYDIAAIKFRGVNAVTNFEMSRYDVEAISSSSLPIGSAAKRLKLSLESDHKPQALTHDMQPQCSSSSNSISFSNAMPPVGSIPTGVPFDPSSAAAFYHHQSLFHQIHGNGVNMPSDSTASATSMSASTPMNLLPSSAAAEFFIWPPHSY